MSSSTLSFPALDTAIGQAEGYGVSGAIPTVNNNPGDIIASNFANSQGAVGNSNGFAVFPNQQVGLTALDNNVGYYANNGFTLDDMLAAWNGNGPNTAQYQSNVLNSLAQQGVSATGDTPVSYLANQSPNSAATPASTTSSNSSPWWNPLGNNVLGSGTGLVTGPTTPTLASIAGITASRWVVGIIGIILIGVGGFALAKGDSVTDVVVNTGKAAGNAVKSGTEVAAVAA